LVLDPSLPKQWQAHVSERGQVARGTDRPLRRDYRMDAVMNELEQSRHDYGLHPYYRGELSQAELLIEDKHALGIADRRG